MAENKVNISLLKKILALARPYKGLFALALAISIISALLAPSIPYVVNLTLDSLLINGSLAYVGQLCAIMIGLIVVKTIVLLFNSYTSSLLGQKVILDLRNKVYGFSLRQRLTFFDKTPIGQLITRNVSDIETLTNFFSQGIITILGDLLQIISIIAVMFYINWSLALVVMIMFPFLAIASRIFGKKVKKSFESVRN